MGGEAVWCGEAAHSPTDWVGDDASSAPWQASQVDDAKAKAAKRAATRRAMDEEESDDDDSQEVNKNLTLIIVSRASSVCLRSCLP